VCVHHSSLTVLHSKKHGSPDVWRRAREDATTNHALPRIVDGRDIPPHTRVADSAGPWTAQQTRWRARPRGAPYCWQWMRGSRHKGRATQHESLSAWLPRGTGGHVTREFERVAATWHGRPRGTRVWRPPPRSTSTAIDEALGGLVSHSEGAGCVDIRLCGHALCMRVVCTRPSHQWRERERERERGGTGVGEGVAVEMPTLLDESLPRRSRRFRHRRFQKSLAVSTVSSPTVSSATFRRARGAA